jgi:Flp pilus assembly protein protease CpaA
MDAALLALATGALALSACCDARSRRIPNELSAGIALISLVRMCMAKHHLAVAADLAAGAAIFAAAFVLFCKGAFGGGDVKLVTATTLLVGYHDAFPFLIIMSFCGAALALCVALRRRSFAGASESRAPAPSANAGSGFDEAILGESVPYGVAIAGAGIGVLLLQNSVWG